MLQAMGSQRVGHDLATKQQQNSIKPSSRLSWEWRFLRKTAMFIVYDSPSLKYFYFEKKMTQVDEYILKIAFDKKNQKLGSCLQICNLPTGKTA